MLDVRSHLAVGEMAKEMDTSIVSKPQTLRLRGRAKNTSLWGTPDGGRPFSFDWRLTRPPPQYTFFIFFYLSSPSSWPTYPTRALLSLSLFLPLLPATNLLPFACCSGWLLQLLWTPVSALWHDEEQAAGRSFLFRSLSFSLSSSSLPFSLYYFSLSYFSPLWLLLSTLLHVLLTFSFSLFLLLMLFFS